MNRRPRILVITNGYPNPHKPYAGMYLKRHVLLHRESGLDVTVLDPRDSRRGPLRTPLRHLRLLLKVLKAMVLGRFDLVHAHWPMPAGLFGATLSRIRRKPFVLTSHGAYVSDFGARSRLTQFLVRHVLRKADTVIAVGHQHADEVRKAGDVADGAEHAARHITQRLKYHDRAGLRSNPPTGMNRRNSTAQIAHANTTQADRLEHGRQLLLLGELADAVDQIGVGLPVPGDP